MTSNLDPAALEAARKAFSPALFSDDEYTRHMEASPIKVETAQRDASDIVERTITAYLDTLSHAGEGEPDAAAMTEFLTETVEQIPDDVRIPPADVILLASEQASDLPNNELWTRAELRDFIIEAIMLDRSRRPSSEAEALAVENHGHPCPKPLKYSTWLVSRAAPLGGSVLDPFLGSGTTGVAAVKLKQPDMFIEPPKPMKQEVLL